MAKRRYFDDINAGPSVLTSHPRFCELATESFYLDCTDDFSPFGSDDGADTLSSLEDWYRDGGRDAEVDDFLGDLMAEWEIEIPDLADASHAVVAAWLDEDPAHEVHLHTLCRAYVATAFGQLKITGAIWPTILREALESLECQLWLNERAQTRNPSWPHAEEQRIKLKKMEALLNGLKPEGHHSPDGQK